MNYSMMIILCKTLIKCAIVIAYGSCNYGEQMRYKAKKLENYGDNL